MFKLLTEEESQKVSHEYTMRRTVVLLVTLIQVMVLGIIWLMPSYVLSSARQNEMRERVIIMGGAGQRGDEAGLQEWLAKINLQLLTLSPKLDTDRPSFFIKRIVDQKSAGVVLTNFSWTKVKDKINLGVNGVASDRQTLITFENRINASGHF